MTDKRTSYIDLYGKEYPLCLTVQAQEQICTDHGSVMALLEKVQDSAVDALPYWVYLLHCLMEGGAARVKALAFISGEPYAKQEVPELETLNQIVGWADIRELMPSIYKAIGLSTSQTVETEETEKNAETAQE